MSTNFDDIYPRLDQSGDFVQANPPMPQPQQPQPQQAPPIDPQKAARAQRMQEWQNLITNFTFSLGSGLQASAAATGGPRNRTMAGVGAALTAPQFLQDIYAKRKLQELEQQKLFQQAQQAPLIGPNGQPILGADGQPVMIPAAQQGADILKQMGIQSQDQRAEDERKRKEKEAADREQVALAKTFQRRNTAGQIEDIPDAELTASQKESRDSQRVVSDLKKAQAAETAARSAYLVARQSNDEKTIELRQKQYEEAVRNHDMIDARARESLGIQQERLAQNTPEAKAQAGLEKEAVTSETSVAALKRLAARNTYIADVAMADQFFNVIKPGSGARMNQAYIDRLMTPGPLKNRMSAMAQKLDQGQLLTAEDRQFMIDAATDVEKSKRESADAAKPKKNTAPAGAEHWGMVNGKWQQIKD